ncbi:MAG: hypothetical protein IJG45_08085 [Oscillospiraceae bacterium]|nr:hypothetical protein [Oscillospiraceae bacterium]
MTRPETVCLCDLCGEELLAGDVCYRVNGLCICPDCLLDFARDYFRTALEVIV